MTKNGAVLAVSAFLLSVFPHASPAGEEAPPPVELDSNGNPIGEAALNCRANYPLLRKNADLMAALAAALEKAGYSEAIRKRKMAVSIVDLTAKNRVYYAGINGNHMMYAASLPKIAALLAYVEAVKDGRLPWNDDVRRRLSRMINASSNKDATWAIEQVGLDYIEKVLRKQGRCFYGDRYGGQWLGKPYRKESKAKRDPLRGLSHGATTRQTARWFVLLDKGLLADPVGSRRMMGVMSPPQKRHKFVKGLKPLGDVRILARKSGTWRTYHSDSILVEHESGVRYVAVGMLDHPRGGRILVDLIRIVDRLMVGGKHRVPRAEPGGGAGSPEIPR
ncbi:MAG: serine hydrolase [Elusimicrobiota bacterium]